MPADNGLGGGERGEGDKEKVGEGDFNVTRRNVGPLDGDLESEQRRDLIAAVSGWWTCVGDGKCSVPPAAERCGEYVTTMRMLSA